MHRLVIHNHKLIEAAHAQMSALTAAALYGRGVFTTLAVHSGRPFRWPQHWARLNTQAARLGVALAGFAEAEAQDALLKLIAANGVEEGRARLSLLAGAFGGVWKVPAGEHHPTSEASDFLIFTGDARHAPAAGLALTLSPYRVNSLSPLAGLKTLNYLEPLLSWEEARARDFDEGVRLNERGELVSAALANLFWVTEGRLHTPALTTGALAGTTRDLVLELAETLSVPHVEGVFELSHLTEAGEIFLTSAGLGIAPVRVFDFRSYVWSQFNVAARLREALRERQEEETAAAG